MIDFVPRWFQGGAEQSVYQYFAENKTGNPLIALPTGTGKSYIPAMMMKNIVMRWPNQRMALVSHVKELIEQDLEKLLELWPLAPVGVYSAGMKRKEAGFPLTFGGVQSMVRSIEAFGKINLLIIDEAHLISPNKATQYQALIDGLKVINPAMRVIGMTATYYRMGSGLLTDEGQLFDDICYNQCTIEGFNRFIDEGFLMPLVPKDVGDELRSDTTGLHTRMGDFVKSEVEERENESERIQKITNDIIVKGKDRHQWLTFCTSIDHSERVAAAMTDKGVPSRAIHSKLTNQERTILLRDFKDGTLKHLTNKDMLTTGHDFPRLDLLNILRPTQSAGLWVQILGRGTRPYFPKGTNIHTIEGRLAGISNSQKKDCLVLDYAGNTARLGPINDPVIPDKKKAGKGKNEAPIKVCENCMTYNHAAVRTCVNCGFEFVYESAEEKLNERASEQELVRKKRKEKVDDMPVVDWFDVDSVDYRYNQAGSRAANLAVTYHCGLRTFTSKILFEHEKPFLRGLAYKWWEERNLVDKEVPKNVNDAVTRACAGELRQPKSIKVWTNKKGGYPEIMLYDYETGRDDNVNGYAKAVRSDGVL